MKILQKYAAKSALAIGYARCFGDHYSGEMKDFGASLFVSAASLVQPNYLKK